MLCCRAFSCDAFDGSNTGGMCCERRSSSAMIAFPRETSARSLRPDTLPSSRKLDDDCAILRRRHGSVRGRGTVTVEMDILWARGGRAGSRFSERRRGWRFFSARFIESDGRICAWLRSGERFGTALAVAGVGRKKDERAYLKLPPADEPQGRREDLHARLAPRARVSLDDPST